MASTIWLNRTNNAANGVDPTTGIAWTVSPLGSASIPDTAGIRRGNTPSQKLGTCPWLLLATDPIDTTAIYSSVAAIYFAWENAIFNKRVCGQ